MSLGCAIRLVFFFDLSALFQHVNLVTTSLRTRFQVYFSKCWDPDVGLGCMIPLGFHCSLSALFQHVDLVTTSLRTGFQVYLS